MKAVVVFAFFLAFLRPALAVDETLQKALGLSAPVRRNEVAGFLSAGRRIVLQRDGRLEIFDRETKTLTALNLTRWGLPSPDETRLFVSYNGVVVNFDGTGLIRPAGDLDPLFIKAGWTPAGNLLLFKGRQYGEAESWPERLRCRMSELRLKEGDNTPSVVREKDFAFNPLDNGIILSPTGTKAAVQFGQVAPYWVKVFDLQTGAEKTVVLSEKTSSVRPVLHFWSPDGTEFVYSWNGLYLATAEGERILLTRETCQPIGFSPDGELLLVKKQQMKGLKLLGTDLYLIDRTGREVRRVTSQPKRIEGTVLFPNGDEVIYSDTTNYKKEYFRILQLK